MFSFNIWKPFFIGDIFHLHHMCSFLYVRTGCDDSLRNGLSLLTVRSSAKEIINTAYQFDERIKKGGI